MPERSCRPPSSPLPHVNSLCPTPCLLLGWLLALAGLRMKMGPAECLQSPGELPSHRPLNLPPLSPALPAGAGGYYRGLRTKIVQSVLAAALLFVAKEKITDWTREVLLGRGAAKQIPLGRKGA